MNGPLTRTLVVMRHAKSSWRTNEPDIRRPLSERGTRDAVVAGQELAKLGLDVVLCSPATRARQTWQCLELGGVHCADVRIRDAIYQGWTPGYLDEVRALPGSARAALLIGHEPVVSDLVISLAVSSVLTERVEEKFPTGAVAILQHELDWDELGFGLARLVAFEVPRG